MRITPLVYAAAVLIPLSVHAQQGRKATHRQCYPGGDPLVARLRIFNCNLRLPFFHADPSVGTNCGGRLCLVACSYA